MPTSPRRRSLNAVMAVALAASMFAPARTVVAQDIFDAKTAAHVRDSYLTDLDTIHSKVMALANAIPADKYSWRPAAGVRSISEVLMHIAGEWYVFTPRSVAGNVPADFGVPREKLPALEKITAKPEVIDQLTKSFAHTRKELTSADPAKLTGKYKPFGVALDEAALVMTGDLHEHLGQLIVYARSVGVKPPWSK